jgi:hypothetical protein
VRDSIEQQGGEIDQEALAKLLNLLRYVGGDYEKPGTFDLLKKTLGSASRPATHKKIFPALYHMVRPWSPGCTCRASLSEIRHKFLLGLLRTESHCLNSVA